MLHALKVLPEYFSALKDGHKNFELRKYDRPFEVTDTIVLQEYDDKQERYTGNEIHSEITYILRNVPKFGLRPGYCIIGLKPKEIIPVKNNQ